MSFVLTQADDIKGLKNEVNDLKNNINAILELKKDIKEIRELLSSTSLSSDSSGIKEVKNEILDLKNSLKEIKDILLSPSNMESRRLIKMRSEISGVSHEVSEGIKNENSMVSESNFTLDNRSMKESTYSQNTSDNNDHSEVMNNAINDNDDSNSEVIYDQRIKYFVKGILGEAYMDYKSLPSYINFNQGISNSSLNNNLKKQFIDYFNKDIAMLCNYYEKLLYLSIEQEDLCKVIDSYYNFDYYSICDNVLTILVEKLVPIINNVNNINKLISSEDSFSLKNIKSNGYYDYYKSNFNNCKAFFDDKFKNGINKVVKEMNIMRLHHLNDKTRYLLTEKNVDNVVIVYEPKSSELSPIIDRLLEKYKDSIYDNEYALNSQYSFHLNKQSFCI